MECLSIGIDRPVIYLKSGQFSAELGWQHHRIPHQQDIEVIIGVSGRVFLQIEHANYTVERGDVLIVFPHETIQGSQATLIASRFIWFHFLAKDVKVSSFSNKKESSLGPDLQLPRFFHLAEPAQPLLAAQQLLDIAHGVHRFEIMRNYQTTLTLLQLGNDYDNQKQKVGFQQTMINQVKEWLRINSYRQLTVPEIAQHFHLNADYLTRQFKQVTGMTLKAYMNVVRLDTAKYLLLTTDLPIFQVSQRAFFNDTKYFARLFKKKTQLTPTQYRQAYTHTFLNNKQVDPGVDVSQLP